MIYQNKPSQNNVIEANDICKNNFYLQKMQIVRTPKNRKFEGRYNLKYNVNLRIESPIKSKINRNEDNLENRKIRRFVKFRRGRK